MIKNIALLFLITLSANAQDQGASVAKSIYGIQTGLLGVYFNNEAKITDAIALRSEVGFDVMWSTGGLYGSTSFGLAPVITLEPRWYYNLDKRLAKGKSISNNSGNFMSLHTNFNPSWFNISNRDLVEQDRIYIMPTWGLRRHIGQHFNYEAGAGAGLGYIVPTKYNYSNEGSFVAVNLLFRIGYTF